MPSPPPPPPPGRQRAVVAVERTVVARGAREPSAAGALVGAPVAELDLDRPATIIGRDGAHVALDSPVVSRAHAVIRRLPDGTHTLEDLRSMNGTFIGAQRVRHVRLKQGDVARIGPYEIVYKGATAAVHDLRGALRLDVRGLGRRVSRGRWILRDVSLSIFPREFVALVGGSGAGKSTLMKLMSAQASPSSGIVQYNGDDAHEGFDRYRAIVGYVPQDDILHRGLPVRRALRYAASLRLPPDTSKAERATRIERALSEVDMLEHADKTISELSGGQRKRVSIASELLADPALFFLDEPTSGLDPGLEKKMMKTLRRLASAGRTVVLVTHATANLTECDHVAFLADGRLVYFGPPRDALGFFRVDSGDMADIYAKLEGSAVPTSLERWRVATLELRFNEKELRAAADEGKAPTLASLWEATFQRSTLYAKWVIERLATLPREETAAARVFRLPRASRLRQYWVLTARYVDLLVRDWKNLAVLLLQAPLIGYLTTLVAAKDAIIGMKPVSAEAKTVLFLLATVSAWFGVINASREIAKETPIFARERLAGVRISAYLGSKLTVLALFVAAQSAILLAIIGSAVDFPVNGVAFGAASELFATTFLSAFAALSLGLFVSAAARSADRAISAIPMALVPQILFSGVLFPLGQEGSVMRVLSWFTISRWSTDAYGVTVHLSRFPDLQKSAEYTFTQDALFEKWAYLGAHSIAYIALAAIVLARRDR